MVSSRCKMVVKEELKNLKLHYSIVNLGMVEILENLTKEQREQLKIALLRSGLELMDDKKSLLIDDIKKVIIDMIRTEDEFPKINFSNYLSEKLGYDYTYMSNIFSEVKGVTITHYIIKLNG